jgi:hypothetical protein
MKSITLRKCNVKNAVYKLATCVKFGGKDFGAKFKTVDNQIMIRLVMGANEGKMGLGDGEQGGMCDGSAFDSV